MIFWGVWAALTVTEAKVPCANYGFRGYNYQKHYAGEDQYYSPSNGVTLKVKCLPAFITFEKIVEKYKKEASARNTSGDAVYFEFNDRGRFRRVYVVDRQPVVELTFSTKRRNRAALDATQPLIEKYYKKSKAPLPP